MPAFRADVTRGKNFCIAVRANFTYQAVALLIKPHPTHKVGILEDLVKDYGRENIFLFDKRIDPYHVINVCDLTITKFSTIGIESMIFKKPVISVIIDRDEHWKVYGDAAEYVYTEEELAELLSAVLSSPETLEKWVRQQVAKQKAFLREYTIQSSNPSAELSARAVVECIRNKRRD